MFLLLILSAYREALAQQLAFYDEISAFKIQDRLHPPPAHPVLFLGSSSFQKWTNVQDYFPGYPILNRGFGGSSLPDIIRYANEIIYPYKPKQVVIYCGDNDLAASDTVTSKTVLNRFISLFNAIRNHLPEVPLLFVSIKPSPSREKLLSKMMKANQMIKEFLQTKKHTAYADVFSKMLDAQGHPIKDIFTEDNLHMNAKGYAIWQKVIQPYLIK